MFTITSGRGFKVTFPNGVTISVQFGPGNYCDTYSTYWQAKREDETYDQMTIRMGREGSTTAEVAFIKGDGFIRSPWNDEDDVIGYVHAKDIPAMMAWAVAQ